MTIVKRNNRLFPAIFDSLLNEDWPVSTGVSDGANSLPAVNIKENEKGYSLELAAPGYRKEDLKIDLEEKLLTLSAELKNGEVKTEGEGETEKYTRKEFNYKSFKRSFTLPETVDVNGIEAEYVNGILSVLLPKKEVAKTLKQISIK